MSVRRVAFFGVSGSNFSNFSLLNSLSNGPSWAKVRRDWPVLEQNEFVRKSIPVRLGYGIPQYNLTDPMKQTLIYSIYPALLAQQQNNLAGTDDDGRAYEMTRDQVERYVASAESMIEPLVNNRIAYKTLFVDLDLPWVVDNKTTNDYLKTTDGHSGVVEITPVYNFYAGEYQDNISSPLIGETILPSIYENEIARILDERDNDSYLGSPTTLNAARSGRGDLIPQSEQDWKEYAQLLADPENFRPSPTLTIFPQTEIKEILDLHKKKNLYPMYVDITFPTAPMGSFMRAVEKAKLSTTLFNEVAQQFNNIDPYTGSRTFYSVAGVASTVEEVNQEEEVNVQVTKHYINASAPKDLQPGSTVTVFNIDEAIRSMINRARSGDIEGAANTEFLSLRGSERNPNATQGSCLSLLDRVYLKAVTDRLDAIIAASSAPSILDRAYRSSQVSHRSLAESDDFQDLAEDFGQEVIGYAVQKHTSNRGLVSTYIFPNTDALNQLKFVDTQVKYRREYYYEVFALVLTTSETGILTTTAMPHNTGQNRIDRYELTKQYEKKLVLAMVPIASDTLLQDVNGNSFPPVEVRDRPPVPPNFTFIPYKGVKNKMLIKLERQTDELTGQRTVPYIPILGGDSAIFDELAEHQRLENFDLPDGHVEFKAEGEDTVTVQVFRTTKAPEHSIDPEDGTITDEKISAYSNFKDNLYREVEASEGLAFTDTLIPNKKYYYTFRSVDINGNFSNPSPIMQVEIVETEGITYPLIREYVPDRAEPDKADARNMAKFIQIRPSYFMSEPLPDEDDRLIVRGRGGDMTFGKHYKIRITSLDTGRQLDVNCTFVGEGMDD